MYKTIFAALAVLAATPGQATQDNSAPSAASESDPAALAAARDLLRAVRYEQQIAATARQSLDATLTTILREVSNREGALPAELEAQFRVAVRDHVERLIVDIQSTALEDAAHIYARHFTAEEIRRIQSLQTDPVMVKMQGIAPQLASELMQIGIAPAARREPELRENLRQLIERWQAQHPEQQPTASDPA